VARDAIARLYDVEKNSVKLVAEPAKGSYQPGTILFSARKNKSIDLDKMYASLQATRLSGGTRMGIDYLEITATGQVVAAERDVLLKVAGTAQQFALGDDPSAKPKEGEKSPFQRLQEALARGAKVTGVTGRVQGWNGVFPVVLRSWPDEATKKPPMLIVTDFQTAGD
jgi:hypothetical protein